MSLSLARAFARFAAASASALAIVVATTPAGAATRYIFSTFFGDAAADEKLGIYTSSDGLNFKLLSKTGYGGPTGVLRDPSILKHTDGKYYVAYTLQSWTTSSTSFGIASSTDLTHWTFLAEVPAGVANAHDTWAPEWFVDDDGGVHLIVNIDTLGNDSDFRSYDFKAKDATLTQWEAPASLGIGPNNIDTFVVKDGATYHAFSKNETTKFIEHATASALHGPWDWVQKGDFAGWGSGKEGIALFKLDDGRWRMFLDCYSGCGFLYADSADLSKWSKTTTVPGLSGVRHGTVLREAEPSGGAGPGAGGVNGRGGEPGRGGAANGGSANGGSANGGAMNGGTTSSQGGRGAAGGSMSATGGTGGASTGGGSSGGAAPATGGDGAFVANGGATNAAGGSSSTSGGASTTASGGAPMRTSDDVETSSSCAVRPSTGKGAWSGLAALGLLFTRGFRRARSSRRGGRS